MSASSFISFLLLAAPTAVLAVSGTGHSTRYWDCCKPSCAWPGKAAVNSPALTCDKNDNPLDPNVQSGCNGGGAFTCSNNSPWAVNDNLAYGFAATAINGGNEGSWCCACYALTFTTGPVAGKTMVVQSTNTGGDLSNNHFDIQMPGGGVGIFNGCLPQYGVNLPGAQYGGISSRSECDSFPELLKDGCYWRFDWFKNADNPDFKFEQVQCPAELTAISGCVRNDDKQFPVFAAPGGTSPAPKSSSIALPPRASSAAAPPKASSAAAPPKASSAAVGIKKSSSTMATSKTTQAAGPSPPSTQLAGKWGQCGGMGWTGPTQCVSGSTCQLQNPWYSQCL